jgi:hypothetical protein
VLLLMGLAAPLLYAFTVAWGATLFPGYSHLADPISSLTQAGRQGTGMLEGLFFIYNGLIIGYGVAGILLSFGRWRQVWSFAFLIATGIAGLVMWFFPQDAIGSPMTPAGVAHISLAAVTSFGSMGAIGAAALGYRAQGAAFMFRLALACLVVVFVSGGLAAIGIGAGSPVAGLLERITIGTFELWLLISAGDFLMQTAREKSTASVH